MSQGGLVLPTTGVFSGLTEQNNINAALAALVSLNSGPTAPSVVTNGMLWWNTTTNLVQQYDGTNWNNLFYVDAANHLSYAQLGGGAQTNIASASTADLWSVPSDSINITGTATITQFANASAVLGTMKVVTFAGALTLTQGTPLALPNNGGNITTAAGDWCLVLATGATNVKVVFYQKANGQALSFNSNFTGAVSINGAITPASLLGSVNDYNPTGLSTANIIRQASGAAYNITGLTAPAVNGTRITIQNVNAVGGPVITLTANDANSAAANRFLFPHPTSLAPEQSVTVVYDSTSGGWRLEHKIYASPIQGGFKNLRVFNVATVFGDTAPASPNTQVSIAADELIVEDGTGNSARLSSVNQTVNIGASGVGGLDTGTVAVNNWYHLWIVFNPSTNTENCLGSLASTLGGLTLPAGYTFAARVGAAYYLTNNSVTGFQRFTQYGRRQQYAVTASTPTPVIPNIANTGSGVQAGTYSTTSPTLAAVSVTAVVPPTAASIRIAVSNVWKGGGGATAAVLVAPSTAWGGTNNGPAGSNGNVYPDYDPGNVNGSRTFDMQLEASTIAWATGGVSLGGAISCFGYEDNL